MRNIKFIIIITVITVILGAGEARAQSLSLSITPPLLEVMIKPGKTITQVYKLTNNGEAVVVIPKLYELGSNGIKENTQFTPDKWITLVGNAGFDKPLLLGKDKTAEFLLKLSPPADLPNDDYYRAVVFATTPNFPADTTISSFAQNLATPLLIPVTATGNLLKAAQVTKFEIPKIIDSFDTLVADIEIKNSGKNYFRPVGKLTLTGPVGRGSYDIIPQAILMGENKKLETSLSDGKNNTTQTLILPGFFIGKYQLELDMTLDESNNRINQTRTFYALPWKGILVIVAIIVIINKLLRGLGSRRSPKSSREK